MTGLAVWKIRKVLLKKSNTGRTHTLGRNLRYRDKRGLILKQNQEERRRVKTRKKGGCGFRQCFRHSDCNLKIRHLFGGVRERS